MVQLLKAEIESADGSQIRSECDLVVESVVEDLSVKKDLFAELDTICKPETMLATNTSTLPVVEMAMATRRRVIEACADTDTLLLAAHFPSPTAARVVSSADGFRFAFDRE